MALSTLISAAALVFVFLSTQIWMLFVATVAFGFATALYWPTRFPVLTDIYSANVGSAIGLTLSAGSLGNDAFPVLATFVAGYTSWRLGFGIFVPLFGLFVIALWLAVPARTSGRESAVDTLSLATSRRIKAGITMDSIPAVVGIQTTVSFIIQGFSSFYPAYLTIVKGVSVATAATLFGLFFAVGAVIHPLAGRAMDRFGAWVTLAAFNSGTVGALWLLPFAHSVLQLFAITVLFSCWNGCGVITQTYIADTLPAEMQGTGLRTLKAGWMTVGATSPLLIGVLGDNDLFDEGFLLLAVVGSLGVILSLWKALGER